LRRGLLAEIAKARQMNARARHRRRRSASFHSGADSACTVAQPPGVDPKLRCAAAVLEKRRHPCDAAQFVASP
jgi:hypothetical protein